jgi:hypothetical protein
METTRFPAGNFQSTLSSCHCFSYTTVLAPDTKLHLQRAHEKEKGQCLNFTENHHHSYSTSSKYQPAEQFLL